MLINEQCRKAGYAIPHTLVCQTVNHFVWRNASRIEVTSGHNQFSHGIHYRPHGEGNGGRLFSQLLAGGYVAFENMLTKKQIRWPKYVFPGLLVATAIVFLPLWLPVFSIQNTIRYGILSIRYDYREMIGWEDLVKTVSIVYDSLPPAEKSLTSIITGNYGESGAINHYGPVYGLPVAASGIASYHYWGPGNENATTFIIVGMPKDFLSRFFSEITVKAEIHNPYGIENEEQWQPVFICRALAFSAN